MPHEKFTELELEAKAQEIMDSFPFDKIHKHMVDTNWVWGITEPHVPTLEEIKIHARSILTQVIYHKNNVINIESGGFTAYKFPWGIRLTFELASRNE